MPEPSNMHAAKGFRSYKLASSYEKVVKADSNILWGIPKNT